MNQIVFSIVIYSYRNLILTTAIQEVVWEGELVLVQGASLKTVTGHKIFGVVPKVQNYKVLPIIDTHIRGPSIKGF